MSISREEGGRLKSPTDISHIITVIDEGEGLAEVCGSELTPVLLWNAQPETKFDLKITSLAEQEVNSPGN